MSIVVAVRVRPFNQREKDLKSTLCVKMKDNSTILINDSGKKRSFTFDHSFWSHDGYIEEKDGCLVAKKKAYADQDKVYAAVGRQVLNNALNGYHCCLFAYGQTGSGKSYSMIGYGVNRGIVPIISQEIFEKIIENTSESKSFKVKFSMLEIYNEKVQDLMTDMQKRPTGGLKIRESKKYGVFVDKLTKHSVKCYEEIEEKMGEGNKNRTIASTQMNASSSRAHTIISIEFTQKEIIYGNVTEKFSVINLVDLAGSEKVSKTGARGDRLREGSSINKSLTVLGMVICALADISMGKKNKVIPYRDSALTRILQNALGGNSKTLMICAISPSNDNYDETLSTLRYADQAKKIKCHAKINESPKDKMIRELKEENERLKKQLLLFQEQGIIPSSKTDVKEPTLESTIDSKMMEEMLDKNKKFEGQIVELQDMLTVAEAKAEEVRQKGTEIKFDPRAKHPLRRISTIRDKNLNHAHLTNINEDPFLTGKIFKDLDHLEKITVGRKSNDPGLPQPVIILASLGIEYNHACVEKIGDEHFLYLNEGRTGGVYHNGNLVKDKVKLRHLDRIIFGTSAVFLMKIPYRSEEAVKEIREEEIDYEFCQMELNQARGDMTGETMGTGGAQQDQFDVEEFMRISKQNNENAMKEKIENATENLKQKIKDLENETTLLKEKDQNSKNEKEAQKRALLQQYEEYIETLEKDLNQKDKLIENERNKKMSSATFNKMKAEEKKMLNRRLAKLSPNITELNLIAQELRRRMAFSAHLTYFFIDHQNMTNYHQQKKYRIKIKVDNKELGYSYFWDLDKFANRYFMIKELLERYFEDNQSIMKLPNEEDPFFDYPQHICFGQGFLKLLSIAYLLDNPIDLTIVGDSGQVGILFVNLIPVDVHGKEIEEDDELFDEFVDDPTELLGHQLDFIVKIGKAEFTQDDMIEPYVSYELMIQDEETKQLRSEVFTTGKAESNNSSVDFQYRKHHTFKNVSKECLEYLLHNNLCFEIHAAPKINPKDSNLSDLDLPEFRNRTNTGKSNKMALASSKKTKSTSKEIDKMNLRIRENIKKKKNGDNTKSKKKKKSSKEGLKRKSDCSVF